ncbi:hypothetical protein [Thiococcus pfennigii]|jgi:hypothetical protein|uniref:hypothetical protein n=1 Tax=Thiococcus pfennigii TaxID=1057 RepID=UPI001904AE2C|nr:hypothetical protein [Thiococcus pfennigii]MBK1699410.1 hypothetical protein [Thiococcus pfennigii]MBK1731357.1 hypothetical protein [Thiococcus pfennigii]
MKTHLAALISLALALPAVAAAQADDASRNRAAMADAMTRMMEAMGFLGQGGPSPGTGWWGGPAGLPTMPSLGNPVPYYGMDGMDDMFERLPQGVPMPGESATPPWQAGPLEGLWESPDGGLLIVQGNHYRLYRPCAGHVDGTLQVGADRLLLRNRSQGIEHSFDMARQDGRLALRGADGQIYVYRRLRLEAPR